MQLLLDGLTVLSIALISFFAIYQIIFAIGGVILFFRSRKEKLTVLEETPELPPLTILVPAHNEEKVIERTVCCLLGLSYPADKLNILVIDDASTDDTPAITDRLAARDPRVRVLHRVKPEGGRGKSAALNDALNYVDTEFIAIFDADNRPEPLALNYLVAKLLKHPELGAAVGRFRTGNRHKNVLTRVINLEGLGFQGIVQSGRWQFLHIAALSGTNYIIRRSVLQILEGWDEEALTEDTELSVRMYQAGYRIAFVPYSITWEQEPETARVWLKQRTRWARGNNYAIAKLIRTFGQSRYKLYALEAMVTLIIPYIFLLAIIDSQLAGLFSLLHITPSSYLVCAGNFSMIAMSLYFLEFMVVLSYDSEINPENFVLVILMYFTYSQFWLVAVLRALWLDVVVREKRTWDKTVRFDTEILSADVPLASCDMMPELALEEPAALPQLQRPRVEEKPATTAAQITPGK